LSASWQKDRLTVQPRFQFNKQQALHKIIELLPGATGLPPIVFYFGADVSDEPAFHEANLNGYSILLRENISRQTAAQYYLRNRGELHKVLIWLNSL
jgi:trehalose-6-phosphatase